MKQCLQMQKTCFKAFKRAVDGDNDEMEKIMKVFKDQRMLILFQTPECSQLRKDICNMVMQLESQRIEECTYFSLGTHFYNGMISHTNNYFHVSNATDIAYSLDFSDNDSPDLLKTAVHPTIQGYHILEKRFVTFSHSIFLAFFRLVDRYLKNQEAKEEESKIKQTSTSIEALAHRSEVQKYRNIFLLPRESNVEQDQPRESNVEQDQPREYSVPWHLDVSLATLLLKEMYIVRDTECERGYTEVELPTSSATGLTIRDALGNDHVIRIDEDDIIIQGGISLQILSNDLLKAQAHSVTKPKQSNIGRISNSTFFYPPFDTKMQTKDTLQTIQIQSTDMNVLDPLVKFSNHWYPGVQWIEFHHHQMLQFHLKAYVTNYKNQHNINQDIKVAFHSFKIPKAKQNLGLSNQTSINGGLLNKELQNQGVLNEGLLNNELQNEGLEWKKKQRECKEMKYFQLSQVDSTMEVGKQFKKYVTDKYSFGIIADQQSNGKGQNKNNWLSPRGNCYVTFLVKFDSNLSYCISLLSAISVLETLQYYINKEFIDQNNNCIDKDNYCSVQPLVKWVNDVHIADRKVAGVLCQVDGDVLSIGIGVNLNSTPDCNTSTSLKKELNLSEDIPVIEFIQRLALNLMANLDDTKRSNSYQDTFSKVQSKLKYLNQHVLIYDETLSQVLHQGIFIGLNDYGNAKLLLQDGSIIEVINGRMRSIN